MENEESENANQEQQVLSRDPKTMLKAAIKLVQVMPPSKLRKNMIGLINLSPQIEDYLIDKISLPLQIETSQAQPYLKTQFNRSGDSYRSPFTNQYYPAAEGFIPGGQLRNIEEIGGVLFQEYTKLYYGGNRIANFYVVGEQGKFSCGFFVKKDCEENEDGFSGNWDSFNIADVRINGEEAEIKLSTTIMIEMKISQVGFGDADLNGFLRKKKAEKVKISGDLTEIVPVIGEMIEDLETNMRQHLQNIYIQKTREIVFTSRYQYTKQYEDNKKNLAQGLKNIQVNK